VYDPDRRKGIVLPDPVTGADLRRFREERGIAIAKIVAESKVGTRTFEDIEADRFDRLPAPVYVRGFLQEYAKVVGLDPKATAESFLARMPKR
jgi:flagellar biosynthesis protein FlhG